MRVAGLVLAALLVCRPLSADWLDTLGKAFSRSFDIGDIAGIVETLLGQVYKSGDPDRVADLDELSYRLQDRKRELERLDISFPEKMATECRATIQEVVDCDTREDALRRLDECDRLLGQGLERLRAMKTSLAAANTKAENLARLLKKYVETAENVPLPMWQNRWLDFYLAWDDAASLRFTINMKLREVDRALTRAEEEARIGGWFARAMRSNLPSCDKEPDLDEAERLLDDKERRERESADRRERDANEIRDRNRPPPTGGLQDVECHERTIVLKVWDHGAQDGDVVTLTLAGQSVLSGFNLNACGGAEPSSGVCMQRRALPPGARLPIIIRAHNEGSQPPNTASIKVEGGCTPELQQYELKTGETATIEIRGSRPGTK